MSSSCLAWSSATLPHVDLIFQSVALIAASTNRSIWWMKIRGGGAQRKNIIIRNMIWDETDLNVLPMEPEDIVYFKAQLETWLNELLTKACGTVENLLESVEYMPDPLDRAIFESDRSFTLRIRDRESFLIKKIQASLEDIEMGDYGICVRCGREISIGRLRARPVTRHCIKCKTLIEITENLIAR
jgi:DnaK suppressor protein